MKRIAVVEDHSDVQFMYRILFRKSPDIEIEAIFDTAEEALESIPRLQPDLIVVDISLPGMSGIELTRILRKNYPDLKILIATGHDPEAYYTEAMDAGANGFIQKGNGKEIRHQVESLVA